MRELKWFIRRWKRWGVITQIWLQQIHIKLHLPCRRRPPLQSRSFWDWQIHPVNMILWTILSNSYKMVNKTILSPTITQRQWQLNSIIIYHFKKKTSSLTQCIKKPSTFKSIDCFYWVWFVHKNLSMMIVKDKGYGTNWPCLD